MEAHLKKTADRVNEIPKDQFMVSSDDEIVEHIRSDALVEVIKLHDDAITMEQEEIRIDVSARRERDYYSESGPILVPGVRITVSIPFSGESRLWRLKPSQRPTSFPLGEIRPPGRDGVGFLDIILERSANDPGESIKRELDWDVELVKRFIGYQAPEVYQCNDQIDNRIRQAIRARRERLEKQEGIAKLLNIPLKKKEGIPSIEPIELQKD
ncbi:MAG: hypothetical protein HGB05_02765 [Chloroflexi bacterium]|nr:hypothetical protein [Chloroflexota bacterium]